MSNPTALESVRRSGITIASDGAEYLKIGEFNPVDATTNPSLVATAVAKPEYAHLFDEAIRYAQQRLPGGTIEEKTDLVLDFLLVQVGVQILNIIPGRVSVSVDPRLGYDYDAIVKKGKSLIALFEECSIPRSRVLVKIPATYAGIRAAHTLETSVNPIHTNLTLIFSLSQAIACAQAGVAVISPFVGRVKDWWAARAIRDGISEEFHEQPLSEHPGIILVHHIRAAYTAYGYKTEVMAAGFRKPEEIIQLGRAGPRGGADIVTLPPDLLDGLRNLEGEEDLSGAFQLQVETRPEPHYFSSSGHTAEAETAFDLASVEEGIALDKVPEGLAKFSADAVILEGRVRAQLQVFEEVSSPSTKVFVGTRVQGMGETRGHPIEVN
ncbi:hypothetical protein BDQ12DRAFT_687072 [Crucibulum laeve]|uniref:Transaldolase n=1 Tax=Crucibulum laeve TaxID=68775 RepID=A0A5C3LWE1_9AGAR|nr:hypothetical protein BDQ12DRAFT_687072 [Crucibulum laeve]